MQTALLIASHTRSTIDVDTLLELYNEYEHNPNDRITKQELIDILNSAVQDGLLSNETTKVSKTSLPLEWCHREDQIISIQEYSFGHDRIREAASRLLSTAAANDDDDPDGSSKMDQLSYSIGTVLAQRGQMEDQGKDWMIVTARGTFGSYRFIVFSHGRCGRRR